MGTRILELGAGAGLLGIILSLRGCSSVVLTDHPSCGTYAMDMVHDNVPAEAAATVRYVPLDWTEPLPPTIAEGCPWDVILCSDLIYSTELHGPLSDTLCALCGAGRTNGVVVPQILFAYESRNPRDERTFFEKLKSGSRGMRFDIEELELKSASGETEETDDFNLIRMTPRRPSA